MTQPGFCGKEIFAQILAKRAQKQSILHFFENFVICFSLKQSKMEVLTFHRKPYVCLNSCSGVIAQDYRKKCTDFGKIGPNCVHP